MNIMVHIKWKARIPQIIVFMALSFSAIFSISCTTYELPYPIAIDDIDILGTYSYDDGEYERIEVTLYSDGYFHEYAYYYDDEETFSDVGTFFYDSKKREVGFFYDLDSSKWNYKAILSEDFTVLKTKDGDLTQIAGPSPLNSISDRNEIPGVYILAYTYDEPVIIELELYPDGSFKERSIYPESEEIWTSRGSYYVSEVSGYISLLYDDWDDKRSPGILDLSKGILFSDEGDFIKTDRSKPGKHFFKYLAL